MWEKGTLAILRLFGCCLGIVLVFPTCVVGQAVSTDSVPTIRSTSELVVVDLVATDAKGTPVHNLTSSDLTIFEDGHPQTIKVFEEHSAGTPAPQPPIPRLAPGKFTNYSPAPGDGALNVLLLDKLNTPMNAQSVVRDQVLKYLKEAPAGTRIAIFALTTQLRLLQGFTSDPAVLRALVKGKKAIPGSSPMMTNSVSGDQPGSDDSMMDTAANALGNTPGAATVLANLQQFESQQQSFQMMLRAQYTLNAFNQLARYLSKLPGRKNLIWFSGSFPISILPDADLQDPFAAVATAEDEFRATVNLLGRSQVAVYPIDARGLMTEPILDASNSGRSLVKNPAAMNHAEQKFFQQTNNEHGTMNQMAEATGGKAFVDTNDLKSAIAEAIEAGANYYTLAYTPTNQNHDGDYRRIEVKLDHPGVKLAYRRGYYADGPSASKHRNQAEDAQTSTTVPYNPLRAAMLHGAPDPIELLFIADVRPTTGDTETALAPGNQADPKISGPYRRYTVTFVANPKDLSCAVAPDGEHHCVLEFLTYAYDADGVLINMQMNGINASFSAERYAAFLKDPLTYRQQISVPVKGEYYLRLGLRDDTADHVGAFELPVATVAKLTPALTPAPGFGTAPKATQK
jgi:VWFA-related protein